MTMLFLLFLWFSFLLFLIRNYLIHLLVLLYISIIRIQFFFGHSDPGSRFLSLPLHGRKILIIGFLLFLRCGRCGTLCLFRLCLRL